MAYTIEIRPLAAMDILEAHDWYESQQLDLGEKFLADLDEFFAMLQRNPQVCSILENEIRQGMLKKFPYQVVYEVFNKSIVVYSVFHASKNPSKKRMG